MGRRELFTACFLIRFLAVNNSGGLRKKRYFAKEFRVL